MFDFGKLDRPKRSGALPDPIEIFRTRPSGTDGAKELWQGQAKALTEWFKDPSATTLISMYTGSGKTIVGCLIAQSYLNQGVASVVYACPTIDLIIQTEREARRIGLNPSTYYRQEFSDDRFQQGKSFCITTYQALLTSRSKFRGQHRPGAIVFDDAHVGERLVRDTFTIVVDRDGRPEAYAALLAHIRPMFSELNLQHSFDAAVDDASAGSVLLVPPSVALRYHEVLEDVLASLIPKDDYELALPYDYLRGKLNLCAVTVSRARVEFTPPFLPSLTMRALEDNETPRVYLSATIQSKGDIARAFGRLPKRIIEPEVDAGRGERLIIFGSKMPDVIRSPDVVRRIGANHKVLISLPSAKAARKWSPIVRAPERKDFSRELDEFRSAKNGFFALVGRYDGIDLPDETCRVMLIDGLPIGASQLENYLFETLHMDRSFLSRISNRLTQLFGRINRGKNDFGLYLVFDRMTENWLRNRRNLTYLPSILSEQVLLAEDFEDQVKGDLSETIVSSIIKQVIGRDPKWVDYYQAHLGDKKISDRLLVDRDENTKIADRYAKREANFITKLWSGDAKGALDEFGDNLDDLIVHDPRLAGWYYVWMGIAHELLGEGSAAEACFVEAVQKGSARLPVPRRKPAKTERMEEEGSFIERGIRAFSIGGLPAIEGMIRKREKEVIPAFDDKSSHRQAEEAVRVIGSTMGFQASRPCTDFGTGPDGLWLDEFSKQAIAFELKSDKSNESEMKKEEVGQSHDHLQWVADAHPDYEVLGLLMMAESEAISRKANPSELMSFVTKKRLRSVWDEYLGVLRQISKKTEIERFAEAAGFGDSPRWTAASVFARLAGTEK